MSICFYIAFHGHGFRCNNEWYSYIEYCSFDYLVDF